MESIPFIAELLDNLTYPVIILLMTIESSFIPFPSEVVVPPAAYMAASNGQMNIFLVVVCASIGSLLGALVNYYLSLWLGRPLVWRFADSRLGHFFLLSREKVEKAENYFKEHGAVGTFVGRLIPGIRQLISIPAGLSRMNLGKFVFYTTLGATIWNIVLAALGYYLAQVVPYDQLDATVAAYEKPIKYGLLALVGLFVLYLIYKGCKKPKKHA